MGRMEINFANRGFARRGPRVSAEWRVTSIDAAKCPEMPQGAPECPMLRHKMQNEPTAELRRFTKVDHGLPRLRRVDLRNGLGKRTHARSIAAETPARYTLTTQRKA